MFQLRSICIATLLLMQATSSFADTRASSAISASPAQTTQQTASEQTLVQQLDLMAARYYQTNQPGATIIVTKGGKTLLRKGYGLASAAEKRAMQADDVMRLGSISKQFTAVSILMLMEEGKLSFSDTLTKFFPDYPESGKKITVEHLLTHTSGIPSYTSKPGFQDTMNKDMSVAEMIATFKNDALEFEPGSTWNYSNSGYFLLGAIIEKVSGMTYAKFVEQRIFVPLGMKNSAYEGFERSTHSHAAGHVQAAAGFEASQKISMTQPYAAGSLTSTVDDLAKWDAAISAGKLLKPGNWQRAFTSYKLSSGKDTNYAYGWSVSTFEGSPVISHAGGINGFSTYALRLPKEKIYVAVLNNAESGIVTPDMVASRLAAQAMGKPLPEFSAIKLDETSLDRYAGVYKIDETNRRQFVRNGDKLIMTRTNGPITILQAYSETGFFRDNNSLLRVEFVKNAQGEVIEVLVHQNGGVTHHARTQEALPKEQSAVQIAPALFDTYAGDYQLAPNFVINIRREGNRFIGHATGQSPIEITAIAENVFVAKEVGAKVSFEKAADGSISHLILSQNGRDMPAKRLPLSAKQADSKTAKSDELKMKKITTAEFDNYVGKYQLGPNFILSVSRDGDRFLTQATGQGVFEITALGENLFEASSIPAKLRFEKTAEGKVDKLVLLQGGREIPAKKLP